MIVNLVTPKMIRAMVVVFMAGMTFMVGCARQMPTSDELAAFKGAGVAAPPVDLERIVQAKPPAGAYRIVPGDLLNINTPFLSSQSNEASEHQGVLVRRVDADGNIILPMVEQVQVGGKTLMEAESVIAAAYYPKQIVNKPAVVVRVVEYDTRYVEISGGVGSPGRYQLRTGDELSLVSLLMRSGNVTPQGAYAIRIKRPDQKQSDAPVVVPLKGLNMPFVDVTLKGGETIEVEKLNPQTFTIMGLVRSPGTYPFPPDERITLLQALGAAGGRDTVSDPRYATVYRQDADGTVVSARFKINGKSDGWTNASLFTDSTYNPSGFTNLKPGDVISVEKDTRTRVRAWLAQVLFFRAGGSATGAAEATYYRDYSPTPSTTVRTAP
jgi:polysaccharide export outer membrane protein